MNRQSLLDVIDEGGYEACLITTFNAYLPFYEHVILHRLKAKGVNHNVVLMDAGWFSESMQSEPPELAGEEYSLVPMRSNGVFHPKMILLVGKSKGALVVGSHNLTLSGFGYNRELTNIIKTEGSDDTAAQAVIRKAWRIALHWLETQPKHADYWRELVDKFHEFAPWLDHPDDDTVAECDVIATNSDADSLFEQLMQYVNEPISRVVSSGAFFDSEMRLVKMLKQRLNPEQIHIGIEPSTVQMPGYIDSDGVQFHDASKLSTGSGYLHAKAIVLELKDGQCILASGSANPSAPAWLGLTNTEIMLVRWGDGARDAAIDLGLMGIPDLQIVSEEQWEAVASNWQPEVERRKTAARYGICFLDKGVVLVQRDSSTQVTACHVNGEAIDKVACEWTVKGDLLCITLPQHHAGIPRVVCVECDGSQELFLIHYMEHIRQRSETGKRRALRLALGGLESDQSDIESFINLIQPLLSYDEPNKAAKGSAAMRQARSEIHSTPIKSLSASIDDWHLAKGDRKEHNDDIVLVLRGLSQMLVNSEARVRSIEHMDQAGRSEEEQIGADDESAADSAEATDPRVIEQPERIRRRVNSLVYKAMQLLKQATFVEENIGKLIAQASVVMAVLRQLRIMEKNRNDKVAKADQVTFVVQEEYQQLTQQLMGVLFDGECSDMLLKQEADLAGSERLPMLVGLTVWLAWQAGIEFITQRPFNESPEELQARIRNNALLFRLAEFVAHVPSALEEAQQSISPLHEGELLWLVNFAALAEIAGDIMNGRHPISHTPSKGCLAWNSAKPALGLRMIEAFDGRIISLVGFSQSKPVLRYGTGDHFRFYNLLA